MKLSSHEAWDVEREPWHPPWYLEFIGESLPPYGDDVARAKAWSRALTRHADAMYTHKHGDRCRAVGSYSSDAKPTTACVHRLCDKEVKESQSDSDCLFVFNSCSGLIDNAKAEVMKHAYGKGQVSSFIEELDGFHIKDHAPKQAANMHAALRGLDPKIPLKLDLGDWEGPGVEIVTLHNLNLPATKVALAEEGVSAPMLDGYTYPLYRGLRKLRYDYVRNVHGKSGINRWVRVAGRGEKALQLEKVVIAFLLEES